MLALLLIFMPGPAFAAEGFNANRPPPPLADAWDATVMLYYGTTGDIGVASGVIMRRSGTTVDILTAAHALEIGCNYEVCENVRVFSQANFAWNARRKVRTPSIAGPLRVIARDGHRDLAILRTEITEDIAPVSLATRCPDDFSDAFAIGFPVTAERPDPVGIEGPSFLAKRWSIGKTTNRASLRPEGSIFFGPIAGTLSVLVTSVDAIGGSSGGPMINAVGQLIGIVIKTGGLNSNVNYVGRGHAESSQINAVGSPCEEIAGFLRAAPPLP